MTPPSKEPDKIVVTNPDPTAAVKEALELAIKNLDEKIDGRFQAIEQATTLAREESKDKLTALKETIQGLANERVAANKELVDQLGKANSTALTAALMTQEKSAIQLKLSFDEANKATNEKIDRIISRLDLGEGRVGGISDNRLMSRQDVQDTKHSADSTRTFIMALIGTVLVATGIIVSVIVSVMLNK